MVDRAIIVKEFMEQDAFAFNVGVDYGSFALDGNVYVDFEQKLFAIKDVVVGNNLLNASIINDIAYVEYAGQKVKFEISNVKDLVAIVMAIVENNEEKEVDNSNTETKTGFVVDIMNEIFGEDVSTYSIGELLKKLQVSISGDLDNIVLNVILSSVISESAKIDFKIVENAVYSIEIDAIESLSADLVVVAYEEPSVMVDEYYDVLGAQEGVFVAKIVDGEKAATVSGTIQLDLTNKVYIAISTKVSGVLVDIKILDNVVYATIGEICISADLNKAKTIYDYVVNNFDIEVVEKDFKWLELLSGLNLNSINPMEMTGLTWTINNEKIEVGYKVGSCEIFATLNDGKKYFAVLTEEQLVDEVVAGQYQNITLPTTSEDVEQFLTKAKTVYDIVCGGIFETTFSATYNGFDFVGSLKLDLNREIIEISDVMAYSEEVKVFDEKVNIRLQKDPETLKQTVYFDFGNMKYKFAIEETVSNEENSTSLKEILTHITSEEFGVVIDFGVFEELVTMLRDYTLTDYINNMIVGIFGNSSNLIVKLSKMNDYVESNILGANVTFVGNDISALGVSVYDVLVAQLNNIQTAESTIANFDTEKYEEYQTDFVKGMFDSIEVTNGIYSFESDIAIRYSTTTFYGDLTAMLVEKYENDEFVGYVPMVSVSTSALGFSSYIYLIDKTVYVDIHGLQIKADLNETTIDEIMAFVEEELGIALSETEETFDPVVPAVEAFRVILPALDEIYGTWLESGLQFKINDKLHYSENSYFYDIVLQAFVETQGNTIVPTKIVLGANIQDPNTTLYDSYEEFLLKDGDNVLEVPETQKLNFAAYLTNITVGKYLSTENLAKIFVSSDNFKTITALKSNYVTTQVSDYNSYQTALDLAGAAYKLTIANESGEYNYKLNISGAILSQDESVQNKTALSVGAVVSVGQLSEAELADANVFKLFDDKYIKVQGDVAIENYTNNVKGSRHEIDLYYESNNTSAIYLTYAHDDYTLDSAGVDNKNNNHIGTNQFKAKIANAKLSEIVAMITSFMKVDLGEDFEKALGLDKNPCTTDFEYLQSLMGIGQTDAGDEISKVDGILSSIENVAAVVKNINLAKGIDSATGNEAIKLTFTVDKDLDSATVEQSGDNAIIQLVMQSEKQSDGTVLNKLRSITLDNLIMGESSFEDIVVTIGDYSASDFTYQYIDDSTDSIEDHFVFDNLAEFVDVAVSTVNTRGFNFAGVAEVSIIGIDLLKVQYDLFASLDANGELYFYLELDVPSFVDVTYNAGGFGETYSIYSAYGFDNRISILEYKNGVLDITQNTYGNRYTGWAAWKKRDEIDCHPEATFTKDQIGANIMKIMAYALGLTDTVYDKIADLVQSMNPYPSLEQTLTSFKVVDNGYEMGIHGASLTGDDSFKDMTVTLGLSGGYSANNRTFKFIDNLKTTLNIADAVKIPVNLQSVSGTNYTTGYGKTLYTNDYYRKQYLAKFA
ncbi:MAG: hypothetical protein J6J24_00780, partial [Clostridia bacterium]|nr:hypothetical protein [Clostridia bacterium]